jgi:hypothetical protein
MTMIDHITSSKPPADAAPRWFHVVVAVSMIMSAGSALVGSLRTSATMEAMLKQNTRLVQANATPILEFGSGNLNEKTRAPELNFSLVNAGSGTARVAWFELKVDGVAVSTVGAMFAKLAAPGQAVFSIDNITTSTPAPRILSVGKEVPIIAWPLPPAGEALVRARWVAIDQARQRGRITVAACYCSVLDACWTSTLQGELPKPVAACDASTHTTFLH